MRPPGAWSQAREKRAAPRAGTDPSVAPAVRTARAEGRLGLAGMRERVESMGGQFWVDSRAGAGTTVSAELPVISEGEVIERD